MISILTTSGTLQPSFNALAVELAELDAASRAAVPMPFAVLGAMVEAIDGVRFRELTDRLNAGRVDLDNLLGAVIEKGFELVAQHQVRVEDATENRKDGSLESE